MIRLSLCHEPARMILLAASAPAEFVVEGRCLITRHKIELHGLRLGSHDAADGAKSHLGVLVVDRRVHEGDEGVGLIMIKDLLDPTAGLFYF